MTYCGNRFGVHHPNGKIVWYDDFNEASRIERDILCPPQKGPTLTLMPHPTKRISQRNYGHDVGEKGGGY